MARNFTLEASRLLTLQEFYITDFAGYDHMLFLLSLVAWGSLKDVWRVIVLATAFTIGHSITLLLAGMGWVHADGRWIEFLIPVSIAQPLGTCGAVQGSANLGEGV